MSLFRWYSDYTCAEDRAPLESDLSADTGDWTDGQGVCFSPAFF